MLLANMILDDPAFYTLSDQADYELKIGEPERAEQTLLKIALKDSLNTGAHDRYISAHFSIPKKQRIGKRNYRYRDDYTIQHFYDGLTYFETSIWGDIGFYGKGLIQFNLGNDTAAIAALQQVKNKKLPYLNNALGRIYSEMGATALAEQYFRKEIENKGSLDNAYAYLIPLLFKQQRTEELHDYLKNPEIKPYFPPDIERAIYLKPFRPVQYGKQLFKGAFSGFNAWGSIGAIFILCIWVIYLEKLDIFEKEKWYHTLVVVLLSMVFSFFTYPLSDFDHVMLGFQANGHFLHDFFYSVLGVGAIQELVKILPLLLLLRFTKVINEPFDYIKYASLSALGFAFVENLIHFRENTLQFMHGEALAGAIFHMFNSSVIAYGLVLNQYKRSKHPLINFLLFFALASLCHGFYDFMEITQAAINSRSTVFTFILLLISLSVWNSLKANTLNHSVFYDKEKSINSDKLQDYLLHSLAGVLLFECLVLALKFGPTMANNAAGYLAIYFVVLSTGSLINFPLVQGQWSDIAYWELPEGELNFDKVLKFKINIVVITQNNHTRAFLPNSGELTRRFKIFLSPDWYLVKLDTPKEFTGFKKDLVLIRAKENFKLLEKGKKTVVAFYLIPKDLNLEKAQLEREDFKFCGWATVVAG